MMGCRETILMSEALENPVGLFDIRGKSALVIGATGALGRTAAVTLGAMGAKLTLASGDAEVLEVVARQVAGVGADVQTMNRRPSSEDDATAIVSAAVSAYGGIDIVVVASGVNVVSKIHEFPVGRWQEVMDANVLGSWLICKAAGQHLIRQGTGGKVVLISSTRGKLGHPGGYTAYCSSKAGVDALVRSLACEWGTHRINVNAIGPTVFRSKLTAWMFTDEDPGKSVREGMLARIPLGRLGEPEDLIGALAFLVSPASDFCTGQVIYVDGGYTAG
jgi:NAD(P)-dependent dehydrogenase (short-subunit alcohol dehydrogenase family)